MLEDLQLRFALSSKQTRGALTIGERILPQIKDPADRKLFERIQKDAGYFERVTRSYELHLRETNVAQMLREDLNAGRPMMPRLVEEMRRLLAADVANQDGKGRVVETEKMFREHPEEFVRTRLRPTKNAPIEGGPFSLTTR